VSGLEPNNWQNALRRIAATCLLAAVGLYLTVDIIKAIAPVLIVLVVVVGVVYSVVCFERHRRSRW
jgi:hypothetical protein